MKRLQIISLFVISLLLLNTPDVISQEKPLPRGDRRDQSRFGIHFDLNAGSARLKTEQELDFGSRMTDWINVNGAGLRAGMRWRSIYYVGFYLDAHLHMGQGEVPITYELYTIEQPDGAGLTEDKLGFSTLLTGVYGGISIPLYRNPRMNTTFFTPRVVSLLVEMGFHALVMTYDDHKVESSHIGISYETETESSDYGLFSAGIGAMIYFRNYLGLYFKVLGGMFPISTVIQSSDPDEVGDTTYGYYHRIILGFQVRL